MKIVDKNAFDKEYLSVPAWCKNVGNRINKFFTKHSFAIWLFEIIVGLAVFIGYMSTYSGEDSIGYAMLAVYAIIATFLAVMAINYIFNLNFEKMFIAIVNMFSFIRRHIALRHMKNQDIIIGVATSDEKFFKAEYSAEVEFNVKNYSLLSMNANVFYHHPKLGWTSSHSSKLNESKQVIIDHNDKDWLTQAEKTKQAFKDKLEQLIALSNNRINRVNFRIDSL